MSGYVENPPHVDERRMRHIPVDELLAGFGATAADVRAAWADPGHPGPARDVARWASRAKDGRESDDVLAAADAMLTREIDFLDRAVGRSRLYGLHYLGDLACLVQAHALTGDARYATRFATLFDQWYESRDLVRGDWPGLDVVWYSLGVSVRSGPVGNALLRFADVAEVGEATWLRMLATLVGGARWLAEEHAPFRHGNWQFSSCNALLQVASMLHDHEEAADWLGVARRRIEDHLALDVYPDGGHYERAPSYHMLCLGTLQEAAIVAEQRLGWALADEPRFTAMHDWLVAMTTQDGWVPPFNDSQVVWTGDHLVVGHHLLDRPDHKALVERWVSRERVRSLLSWLPPRPGRGDPVAEYEAAPSAPVEPERSVWLAGSRFAVSRTGWDHGDLHLAVNCGPLVEHELESHSHRTALDFVLVAGGRPLVWEAGGPASYDDESYHSWYQATDAHSTIHLPGPALDDEHEAALETWVVLPTIDVVSAAHDGWGSRHTRSLLVVHADGVAPYVVLTDTVDGATEIVSVLHASDPWASSATDRHETSGLLVVGSRPVDVTSTRHPEGVASYPDRAKGRAYAPLHGLRRTLRGGVDRTVLVPFRDRPPDVRVEQGEALTVRLDDHVDTFGERSWARSRAGVPVAGAGWAGGVPVVGGRVLAGGSGVDAVSVRWRDDGVDAVAVTEGRTAVRLFAPHATRALVDGVDTGLRRSGDDVLVAVPSAGRWSVRVTP